MCRLAYIPRPFDGMADWLAEMERSNGGHGTGLAIGLRLVKAVKHDAEWAAAEIERNHRAAKKAHRRSAPALWHTRYTSSGSTVDVLCHPFACGGGFLAHNGHWHYMHTFAAKYKDYSDTRMFSTVVDKLGFAKAVHGYSPPGVWLHMLEDGRLAVWKQGGSLWYNPYLCVLGSQPPIFGDDNWFKVEDGFYPYQVVRGEKYSPCRRATASV